MWKCIITQAVPLTIAQLVQLLYNVVDRIYIGHMGDGSSIALTGVGLTFPIVTLIMAFTALFGMGGVPLFSMARGAGKKEQAEKILGNSFGLLMISAVVLTVVSYCSAARSYSCLALVKAFLCICAGVSKNLPHRHAFFHADNRSEWIY